MKSRRPRWRRLPAGPGLVLAAFAQLSCFAEPVVGEKFDAAGGAPTSEPSGGAAGEGQIAESQPARLGIVHAADGLPSVEWTLTQAEASVAEGSLDMRGVKRLIDLPAGSYALTLQLGNQEVIEELELTAGSEVNVVLTPNISGDADWQAHVIQSDTTGDGVDEGTPSARLFVVNAARGGTRSLDVGNEGAADGELETDHASAQYALDVTRPTLALLDDAGIAATFTLPPAEKGTTMLVVLLGDPAADGLAATGERLLVARSNGDEQAQEVRPDPRLYFIHASAAHSGLDLFIARGNPIKTTITTATSSASIAAFLPDNGVNQRRVLAEVVDNARFGELRVGHVPPSAATLELYLTIPFDPQVPAPLNYNLVGNLTPNQRLRNGPALGRQGTQTVDGELKAGAEYFLLAPSLGLFESNHLAAAAPKAPTFPFERVARTTLPEGQFSLRVAASVKVANTNELTSITVDGTSLLTEGLRYRPSEATLFPAGAHEVKVDIGPSITDTLALEAQAGQDLLLIVAGDAAPAPPTAASAPRTDDFDGDGAVCSATDPETFRFIDPNYLPVDGNSALIQDDCPNEPGPLLHQGCPATPLHWLIVDFSTRPPALRAVPLAE